MDKLHSRKNKKSELGAAASMDYSLRVCTQSCAHKGVRNNKTVRQKMTNFVYQIFSTILKLCMKSTRFIKAKDDAKTMRGMSQKSKKWETSQHKCTVSIKWQYWWYWCPVKDNQVHRNKMLCALRLSMVQYNTETKIVKYETRKWRNY